MGNQFSSASCKIWTGLDFFLRGVIFFFGGGEVSVVVLFFLVFKKLAFSTFPQQAIFFRLGAEGRRVVL